MRLIMLAAAGIAAVLFSRRKSLKEDAERVKTAASESTHKISERVRPQSDEEAEAEAEAGEAEPGQAGAGEVDEAGEPEAGEVDEAGDTGANDTKGS